jgi:hypothetical protein
LIGAEHDPSTPNLSPALSSSEFEVNSVPFAVLVARASYRISLPCGNEQLVTEELRVGLRQS